MIPAQPESGHADACHCTALRQAARHLSQFYDTALAPLGLSVNQYSVLRRVWRHGPCAMQAVADALVMDRSTLGHLLRPLEARDLVSLAPVPDDRRRKRLALTPAGSALLEAARPLWAEAQHRFTAAYGAAEAARLRVMLEDVAALPLTLPAPPRTSPPQVSG